MHTHTPTETIGSLTAERLTARLDELISDERLLLVDFLLHLAEFDRRQLHVALGYSSLFLYCTQHLRLSNASAYRRTTAARLLTDYPVAVEFLRSGRLCLTTVCLLRHVLTADNHPDVLECAAGRTEDEVKVLVATLAPKPAPVDAIRRLPAPACVVAAPASGPEVELPRASPCPAPRAKVEPINAEQHVVRMVVGREFLAELQEVRDALSHKLPGASLEQLLRECMRVTLDACGRRKHGATPGKSGRPVKPAAVVPATESEAGTGRTLPIEVRRQVWTRDAGRCAFVGKSGKRCGSTHQLEFHHVVPYAAGGAATVDNVTLHCRVHNQHRAREDFGEEHMAQFGADPRQRSLW